MGQALGPGICHFPLAASSQERGQYPRFTVDKTKAQSHKSDPSFLSQFVIKKRLELKS